MQTHASNSLGGFDDEYFDYTYTGNQLTKVTDAVTTPITYEGAFHLVDEADVANEYAYDANGNLTRDLNKNITFISYNSLNLPDVITFANGNTVTYVYDGSGTVLQVNHYYPFGGLFGEGIQDSNQPYKYNGKELDRLFGLDIYDYGARHYDPATGRWGTPDPLMEKYYPISTYVMGGLSRP